MKRFSASIRALVLLAVLCLGVPLRAAYFETPVERENFNVTIRIGVMDAPGGKIDFCVKAEGRRLVFYVPDFDLARIHGDPRTPDGIGTSPDRADCGCSTSRSA